MHFFSSDLCLQKKNALCPANNFGEAVVWNRLPFDFSQQVHVVVSAGGIAANGSTSRFEAPSGLRIPAPSEFEGTFDTFLGQRQTRLCQRDFALSQTLRD